MKDATAGFAWDADKERENIGKHGVDFAEAAKAFLDPARCVYTDQKHSVREERFFCMGKVDGLVLTVRFTYRAGTIRIIGAGYWRKGARYYEKDSER